MGGGGGGGGGGGAGRRQPAAADSADTPSAMETRLFWGIQTSAMSSLLSASRGNQTYQSSITLAGTTIWFAEAPTLKDSMKWYRSLATRLTNSCLPASLDPSFALSSSAHPQILLSIAFSNKPTSSKYNF